MGHADPNVFRRSRDGIRHFWGSELLYVPPEPGQEYRHNDLLDPVWDMFDLAPEGRGDFQPKLDYTSGVRQMDAKGKQKDKQMAKNTICLWYDKDAEAAARFYAETFPDSAVGAVHRAPSDYPSGKEGDVLTVEFTVAGVPCIGLNGGPMFKHNEAFSFQIATDDQQETDRYWNAIVGNGGQESHAAGAKTSGASPGKSRRAC